MSTLDVVVRAYDLGGYGDIAGALRVTEYLARQGLKIGILPASKSAKEKLLSLEPNCEWIVKKSGQNGALLVDVAGHYLDDRAPGELPAPHFFIEDMDNEVDRKDEVPIYVKTGFVEKPVPKQLSDLGIKNHPLFYRPYKESEIPERKNIDVVELVIKQIEARTQLCGGERRTHIAEVCRILKDAEKIGFAHLQPNVGARNIVESAYVACLVIAAQNTGKKY